MTLINKWILHLGAKILIIGSNALPLNKLPHPFSKTAVFCPTSPLTLTVFVCLFPLGIQVNRDNSPYQGCGEPGPLSMTHGRFHQKKKETEVKQFTFLSCSLSYTNSVIAYTQQLEVAYQVTALLHTCTCTLKFILTQSFRVTQIRQRKSFFARHASTVEYGRSCRQLVVLSATGHNWGHLGLVVWNVIYVLDRFLFSIYRMNLIV